MSGVPVTLGELRQAVRDYCQLDVNDPRATDPLLNAYICAALHRFAVANPNGWSWDKVFHTGSPWFVGAGVEDFFFHYGGTPIGLSVSAYFVRIRSIELILPGSLGRIPLERLTREEQLSRFPRDSDRRMPRTYSLMGKQNGTFPGTGDFVSCKFRPVPDVDYTARVYGTSPLPDLTIDTYPTSGQTDNQIGDYADCIVAYASFLVMRARGDLAEAYLGAKSYFDEQVMSLRKTNRIRVGAGYGNNPVADANGELL